VKNKEIKIHSKVSTKELKITKKSATFKLPNSLN